MVSIDNVYKTVLNILNKENRGYITKDEFNTLALQAQSEIFEGYFSFRNYVATNDSDYSDIRGNVEEKISGFENDETVSSGTFSNAEGDTTSSYFAYPSNFYRLTGVSAGNVQVQEADKKKILYINRSPLTKPTTSSPVYIKHEGGVVIYPTTGITSALISYIRQPAEPKWVGTTISGQHIATPSDANYKDFELHTSEFAELVVKILFYAGVIVRAADVTQLASVKEQQITQSER